MYNIDDFPMLTPMKYYNNEDVSNSKRQAMIDNEDKQFIATKKNDGDWSMLIHWEKGKNLVRSRSISKVTGVYGDYTAKVPHIVEEMDNWPDNTVVLAELCWDEDGTNANTVGTILRCLPAKAVERQKEKKLKAVIFDMLMVNGQDLTKQGYYFRLEEVLLFPRGLYTYPTEVFTDNFAEAADKVIAGGGEGIIIQRCDYEYSPGSRTAWKTLKLKQQLPEMELKVVGTLDPKKYYEGDCPESWEYELEDPITHDRYLVTKPYYYGWKNGITVELADGTTTDVASGLTDQDREWLATEDAAKMIEAGELYAVVKAMSFNDKGRLRHPSLVRLRNDM
jgi:ATP-dependent DNA ligase